MHKAVAEIETSDPDVIVKSLSPDTPGGGKFDASLNSKAGKVVLTVESEEISGLVAGLSNNLRLIKAAADSLKLVKQDG